MKPKVLVIRFSSLGDIVLSTSVLDPLRQAGYEIVFLTKKAFAPVLEGHPDISALYLYGEGDDREAERREKFFSWFESEEFAFVLDLHDSWRSRFWRRRLRRKCPVFVAKKERLREWGIFLLRLRSTLAFGRGGRAKKFRRAAIDALSEVKNFAPSSGPLTRLAVSLEEKESVRSLLPKGDFAVLLPGGAWKGKEWPYFNELAEVLARKVPVLTLGGEKDTICDEVASAARARLGSRSLRGQTNLRQSMAILAQARWVIGNDTGMVHVAEALGRDVAMLEGPTHEAMGFSPYRERSVLLGLPLFCRPCSKTGNFCPRMGSRKCMNDLTSQLVIERLRLSGYPC